MSSNNFTEVRLVDICDLISRGITPSYTDNKEEGIVVLNQKCIRDNRINLELSRLTNPNKKKITESKFLKKYDILVNSTGVGTLGRVAQIKNLDCKMTVDSHITIIRPKEEINPIFLGYNLFMNQKYIESLGEGSTGQTELSRVRLGEVLKIKVPKLIEQKAIAKILSDLDEKIEINNKINENLEKIAQAIFKQWFVDFEFPNENGEPYKSSGGEMIESELGEIPKGWEVNKLSELANMKNGVNYGRDQEGEEIKVVNVRDFDGSLLVDYEKLDSIFLSKKQIEDYKLEKYDTVIVRSAKPGETLLVNDSKLKVYSGFTIRIRVKNYDKKLYTFYCVRNSIKQLENSSNGTIFKNLNQQLLGALNIIEPCKKVLEKYNRIICSIIEKIYSINEENTKLIKLRDTLLPKLMSGEIRVPLD